LTFPKHSRASRDFWFFTEEASNFFCQQSKSAHSFLKEESLTQSRSLLQYATYLSKLTSENENQYSGTLLFQAGCAEMLFYNIIEYCAV